MAFIELQQHFQCSMFSILKLANSFQGSNHFQIWSAYFRPYGDVTCLNLDKKIFELWDNREMTTLTLKYFGLKARGEVPRLILRGAGIPFNDCRYDFTMRPPKNPETAKRLSQFLMPHNFGKFEFYDHFA